MGLMTVLFSLDAETGIEIDVSDLGATIRVRPVRDLPGLSIMGTRIAVETFLEEMVTLARVEGLSIDVGRPGDAAA